MATKARRALGRRHKARWNAYYAERAKTLNQRLMDGLDDAERIMSELGWEPYDPDSVRRLVQRGV